MKLKTTPKSKFLIYEPEATTNLVTNPRLADNATGYNASGSTISRSLDRARWGRACLKVVTNGAGLNEGAFFRIDPAQKNKPFAASVYVRGSGEIRARLRDGTNGIEFFTDPLVIDDGHWSRLEIKGAVGRAVSDDLRLYVETARTIQSVTFYADGFQIEQKGKATTYCDGDLELDLPPHIGQPYFKWTGTMNGSTSTRSADYRPAGTPRSLELEDVGMFVTQVAGLGMPPIRLNLQELGSGERSLIQSHRALARAINMVFWAKKDREGVCSPASLRELHDLRESLEALIKPDRSPGSQPFRLRYLDGSDSMDVLAHYESGLEFDGDLRFPWFNSFSVRLLVPDPYWTADGQDLQQLLANSSVTNSDYIVAKIAGVWQAMGSGADGSVFAIVVHPGGDVYAGGTFNSMGGVANTRYVARWDGSEWHALATGIDAFAGGGVNQIACGPDGSVYVGGLYSTINAVDFNGIAKYTPSSDTFTPMGPGPGFTGSGSVQALAVDRDNRVYMGGSFISKFGGGTLNRICFWDPDSDDFIQMGAEIGVNASVHEIIVDLDGKTIYFAGDFTQQAGGTALDRVGKYDLDTDTITQMGEAGANARVRAVILAKDGRIYGSGEFTSIGWGAAEKAGVFDRQDWHPLGQIGDGLIGGTTARAIAVLPSGRVLFGGDFTEATGADQAVALASWNGTNFSHMDIELESGTTVIMLANNREDIYIGFDSAGTAALVPYQVTVTNRGKATVAPILECIGPARLLWLENLTTEAVIRMNLELQANERVLIDLREGMFKAVSNFHGDVGYGILPDSDVGAFRLVPGQNVIAFKAKDTGPETEFSLRWPVYHWSFDDISWARGTG